MKHLRLALTMLTIFTIGYIDAIERGRRGTREPGEPTRQQGRTQTRGQREAQTQRQTQPTEEPGMQQQEEPTAPQQEEPTAPQQEEPTAPQQEEPQTQETVRLYGIDETSTFKDVYDYIKSLRPTDVNDVFSGNRLSTQFIQNTIAQVRTAGLSNIELEFLLRTARDKFLAEKLTGDNARDLEILKGINQQIQEAKNTISGTPQATTRRGRVAASRTPATTQPATQTSSRGGIQRGRRSQTSSYRGGR